MPNRAFLETYPLYRRLTGTFPLTLDRLPKVQIKMLCPDEGSDQTFVMTNEYWEGKPYSNYELAGETLWLRYLCASCQKEQRDFFIHFGDDAAAIWKVGQLPPWEVKGDAALERLLGRHSNYLKRGMVCESQGYGIAAFAYYRRIVEETIDSLLDQITGLLSGQELASYQQALADTKRTRVTADKIELVKDLLPPILRPEGMNPLKVLHETLSEGLHAETDDACLESADAVRKILVFLASQIAAARDTQRTFSDSMRAFLDKKSASTKG